MKTALVIFLIVALAIVAGFFWLGFSSRSNPPALGINGNQFVACPDSPNCVSSDATGADHGFPTLELSATATWPAISAQVEQMDGVTITEQSPGYLRAEVRSSIFGFVDDLEVHQRDNSLALRSSSRVGHSDMGANRKRLESLQGRLNTAGLLR
ncbi:MAG: DUF1499 domain-containing protein [Lysobacterales bacterium]